MKQIRLKDKIMVIDSCNYCPCLIPILDENYCALAETVDVSVTLSESDTKFIHPSCPLEDCD